MPRSHAYCTQCSNLGRKRVQIQPKSLLEIFLILKSVVWPDLSLLSEFVVSPKKHDSHSCYSKSALVKSLSTMWETQVRSLGQENPLEKEMATHSCTLAWKIPWTEEPEGLQSMELPRVRHNLVTNTLKHSFVLKKLTNQ